MKKIKSFLYDKLKNIYSLILCIVTGVFGIRAAKCFDARLRFGRKLDLKNPKNLADKVSYISIFALPELAVKCTDKWEAREYVRGKGLEDILIPVCGKAVSKADELDFSALPNEFVLKATHGCKMNYICADKSKLNEAAVRDTVGKWLKTTYGTFSVEPHYRKLAHRAYCEELIASPKRLIDYKFFCCNGVPEVVLVCSERESNEAAASKVKMKLYDMQWQYVDGLKANGRHKEADGEFVKPQNFGDMIAVSKTLSEDFDFVRVDLYNIDGKIYFGELTFTPANGVFEAYTDEFLNEMGNKLTITGKDMLFES